MFIIYKLLFLLELFLIYYTSCYMSILTLKIFLLKYFLTFYIVCVIIQTMTATCQNQHHTYKEEKQNMGDILKLGTPLIIGAIVLVVILIVMTGYVKAPPDQAYIISGMGKKPKILIGQAGIRIPFLERMDRLYLGQMTVDIKTEDSVPTNDFINVNVDAVAKIRISPTQEGILLAAKNFLNEKPERIASDLQDSLQGNMREIIGTLTLKQINTDRDSFSDQVMEKASPDMAKLGIEILSCNIQNVTDENGLIKDMGADNTSRIKKDASIAKAQADRDVAIAQAQADREANEARVAADAAIAEKDNELAIRRAELKKLSDTKQAEADAAYDIQKETQRKQVETARVDADIATAEREAVLKEQQVKVTKQTLDAEVRAKADADRYAAEQRAEADRHVAEQQAEADRFRRQQDAEAKLFEQQKEAEAQKAAAEASKFAKEQEAAGISAVGLAEAEAIKAKGLAEAEAIMKKAEAQKQMGEASVIEMIMAALPEIAANVAAPLSNVDKITMYGEGNSAKLIQDIVNGTTQVSEGILQGMGIDMKALISGAMGAKLLGSGGSTTVVVPGSGETPKAPQTVQVPRHSPGGPKPRQE